MCIRDSHYTVWLDHEPRDFKNAAAAGADLILSGHTHGGQCAGLGNHVVGGLKVALGDVLDEAWNINFNGAAAAAGVVLALQAAPVSYTHLEQLRAAV